MCGGDVGLLEIVLELGRGHLDLLLAVGAAVGDHRLDLGVLARVEDLEREILELPLDGVDAEPVGERRVDLERLLRLLHLLLLAEVLDRAHVVEPVGELDQDHAHVLRHRHDHLAVVLRLRLLAALEADPGQLGDALDELRDVRPERGSQLVEVGLGVLDHVVQQRRGDRLLVEVELGADQGDAERMVDERLAGAPHLAAVGALGLVEGAADQLLVDARVVGLDARDQLTDEVVLMTFRIDDGHGLSLLVPFRVTGLGIPMPKEHWAMGAAPPISRASPRAAAARGAGALALQGGAPRGRDAQANRLSVRRATLLAAYAACGSVIGTPCSSSTRKVGDSSSCRLPAAPSIASSSKIRRASGVHAGSPARQSSASQRRSSS